MTAALYLQYLTSVVSMGLGCGACCTPLVSVFLSVYTVSYARSVKRSMQIFFHFFLGKVSAIVLMCVFTSLLRKKWINDVWMGDFKQQNLVEIALMLLGIFMICNWIFQKRKHAACSSCGHKCGLRTKTAGVPQEKKNRWAVYAAGFIYGISPCPPMILLMGYALMLSIPKLLILALVFAVVSSFSSMLIMIFVAGIISKRMYEEIPKMVVWVRLFCYVLFTTMAAIMVVKDL
jgi:sulfite exporter TauE/SafE